MRSVFGVIWENISDYPRPAALLMLAASLYSLRAVVLTALGRPTRNLPWVFYGSMGLIYLVFIIGLLIVARRDKAFRQEIGLVWGGGKLATILAASLGGIALGVVLVRGGRFGLTRPTNDPLLLVGIGLGVALAAPLVEEIIFRGLLLAYLLRWLPRHLPQLPWPVPNLAIGLTALAFALVHLGSSPLFLGTLFVGGLIYGWVRWQSGSLWPSFVGHAAWNSVLVIGQLIS